MSFRELTIIDVKEVLRRWAAGQSARQMAREGVVSRRTATRYIEAATSLGLLPSTPLTEEAVQGVAQCVQARPTPAISDPRQLLETQRIRIEKWLQQDEPLTLVRVRELLAQWHRCLVHDASPLGTRGARFRQPQSDGARR
jgi:predicted DNA-binding transcriptional regulator YafY